MLEEFKKFAMRGNVIDLAVGVIIGAAFGGIVNSLVADIIMPVIGAVTGGLDFSNYYTALSSKVQPGLSYVDASGSRLGAVPDHRIELSYHRMGLILGDQRNKQAEKRRTSRAISRPDARGQAPD